MHEFDYDVMQKAKIARSAKHKTASVRGSRKCTLPSDYMTQVEKRKLNGEVNTYRLDKPMSWEEFKEMPDDLQAEYLRRLISAYGVNAKVLGEMFGKNNQTIINRQKKLGIPSAHRGTRMSARQEGLWQIFLEGGAETEEASSCEKQRPTEEKAQVTEEPDRMCLDCFTACVTGQYSPEALLAILGTMPIPEGKCSIRIEVTRV